MAAGWRKQDARRRPLGAALGLIGLLGPANSAAAGEGLPAALLRLEADDILVADRAVEEIVAHGPEAADPLLALLEDPRRDVRAGAIRGLGLLREARAAAPLRQLLRTSLDRPEPDTFAERYFRILAIRALGRIGDAEAAGLLREVCARTDEFDRAHAGISLFLLGEDPGYDVVRDCLASHGLPLRNLAVEGVGESDTDHARDLVLSMIVDPSWVVRDTAYRALARWRDDPTVGEALAQGAEDPSWFVRQTVDEARRGGPPRAGARDKERVEP